MNVQSKNQAGDRRAIILVVGGFIAAVILVGVLRSVVTPFGSADSNSSVHQHQSEIPQAGGSHVRVGSGRDRTVQEADRMPRFLDELNTAEGLEQAKEIIRRYALMGLFRDLSDAQIADLISGVEEITYFQQLLMFTLHGRLKHEGFDEDRLAGVLALVDRSNSSSNFLSIMVSHLSLFQPDTFDRKIEAIPQEYREVIYLSIQDRLSSMRGEEQLAFASEYLDNTRDPLLADAAGRFYIEHLDSAELGRIEEWLLTFDTGGVTNLSQGALIKAYEEAGRSGDSVSFINRLIEAGRLAQAGAGALQVVSHSSDSGEELTRWALELPEELPRTRSVQLSAFSRWRRQDRSSALEFLEAQQESEVMDFLRRAAERVDEADRRWEERQREMNR